MRRPNVQVIVASEYPEARYFLQEMVEPEGGITVSQAPDVPKALTLVKNLKPDVAIIDCHLPYGASTYNLPLSRTGGLDIAQIITQEAPGTKVVLLNNLDTVISTDRALPREDGDTYTMKNLENDMPLVIRDLRPSMKVPNTLVFADIEAKPQELQVQTRTSATDKTIFFGALAIVLGWFLIISMISATIGAAISGVGVGAVILGIVGKLTNPLWRRLLGKRLWR
ncbi:MAG: hypothetical protein HYX79_06330 [Chloroflexi bacterium]|nr:hypothetical protein [Chloroflexota bacterium]